MIDSKRYRGRLQLDPTRRLWHGRYPRFVSMDRRGPQQRLSPPCLAGPCISAGIRKFVAGHPGYPVAGRDLYPVVDRAVPPPCIP
jgi:hypothetical protein